jgi:hypothetical protein
LGTGTVADSAVFFLSPGRGVMLGARALYQPAPEFLGQKRAQNMTKVPTAVSAPRPNTVSSRVIETEERANPLQ